MGQAGCRTCVFGYRLAEYAAIRHSTCYHAISKGLRFRCRVSCCKEIVCVSDAAAVEGDRDRKSWRLFFRLMVSAFMCVNCERHICIGRASPADDERCHVCVPELLGVSALLNCGLKPGAQQPQPSPSPYHPITSAAWSATRRSWLQKRCSK